MSDEEYGDEDFENYDEDFEVRLANSCSTTPPGMHVTRACHATPATLALVTSLAQCWALVSCSSPLRALLFPTHHMCMLRCKLQHTQSAETRHGPLTPVGMPA